MYIILRRWAFLLVKLHDWSPDTVLLLFIPFLSHSVNKHQNAYWISFFILYVTKTDLPKQCTPCHILLRWGEKLLLQFRFYFQLFFTALQWPFFNTFFDTILISFDPSTLEKAANKFSPWSWGHVITQCQKIECNIIRTIIAINTERMNRNNGTILALASECYSYPSTIAAPTHVFLPWHPFLVFYEGCNGEAIRFSPSALSLLVSPPPPLPRPRPHPRPSPQTISRLKRTRWSVAVWESFVFLLLQPNTLLPLSLHFISPYFSLHLHILIHPFLTLSFPFSSSSP